MTLATRRSAALAALLLLGACSAGPSSVGSPTGSISATAPAASAPVAAATTPADECGSRRRTVLVPHCAAGRSGRSARHRSRSPNAWAEVTATTGSPQTSDVEGQRRGLHRVRTMPPCSRRTKGIGTPEPVNLGDEAYSIFNESIGTVVVARKGDATRHRPGPDGKCRRGPVAPGDRTRRRPFSRASRRARGDDRALARAHCHGSRLKVQSRRPLAGSIASSTTAKPRAT